MRHRNGVGRDNGSGSSVTTDVFGQHLLPHLPWRIGSGVLVGGLPPGEGLPPACQPPQAAARCSAL
eukprot:1157526-Pelagomonas_calceolata.AAC.9